MIRSRATWLGRANLLLPMLFASACATLQDLGSKPVTAAPTVYSSRQSFSGPTSAWPTDGWWRTYNDPQLNGLIDEAAARSPDLAAALARFRTAQGLAQQAGAALLPNLDGAASIDVEKPSSNLAGQGHRTSDWQTKGTVGLSLNLDLDLFGKNRAALRAAKKDAEAARLEAEEARLVLTTGIASAYAGLASLYTQRDNLEAALEIRTATLKFVRARYDAGLETIDSVRLAEARVPQTRSDIAATDEAILLAKHALAALAGEGPDRSLNIRRPSVALQPQGVPPNASINLVGRRPDLAAARARVEASGERIRQARAAFYPDINLTALVGIQSLGLGHLFEGGSKFASASPAISLPLFEGGALQGQYRARRGEYDEAVAQYDGLVVQAFRETADALTSQKQLGERLNQAEMALRDYDDALRVARGRYEEGVTDYLTVLNAQESVVSARLTVAELRSRAFTLDVQLVRALGGGFVAA